MPNLETIDRFFGALFGTAPPHIEFRTMPGDKYWREWTTRAEAPAKAFSLLSQGYDVRFGVLPRKCGGGKAQDISAYQLLYADLDVTPAKAYTQLAILPTPTVIVSSGRGLHTYWVLHEPCPPSNKVLWNRVQYQLVHKLQADTQGIDPTRMLRIPTSYNAKRQKDVELVECSDTKYSLEAFAERFGITSRVLNQAPPDKHGASLAFKHRAPVHIPVTGAVEIESATTQAEWADMPPSLALFLAAIGLEYRWNTKERIARLVSCPACLLGPKRQSEKMCAWVDVFGNLRCWRDGCPAGREQNPGGLFPAEWAVPWLAATGRPALNDAALRALEANR